MRYTCTEMLFSDVKKNLSKQGDLWKFSALFEKKITLRRLLSVLSY